MSQSKVTTWPPVGPAGQGKRSMDDHALEIRSRDDRLTAVEFVVQQVTEDIRKTHYKPGHHLVEAELMRTLAVSRSSVREAMRQLAAAGLVHVERNKGARVREMSAVEVVDLIQVRAVLEGLAARLAATRMEVSEHHAQFHALMEEMIRSEALKDWDAYHLQNQRFHDLVIALSGNEELERLVGQLRIQTLRVQFYFRLSRFAQAKQSRADHEKIIGAIVDGDGERAERAMRAHILRTIDWILGVPQPGPTESG